jgi:predicted DNA-binding protein YlxM (UPF0122 family)
MIEKKLRLVDLFDFYGKMLTEKQYEIMDLYCNCDLSLAEISENLSISRQAVHDAIKRSDKILERYEMQLGLYERSQKRENDFMKIIRLIRNYQTSGDEALLEQVMRIAEKQTGLSE